MNKEKDPPVSKVILGSQSPRRVALLETLGVHIFRICPSGVDETAHSKELPQHLVQRLAQQKAQRVFELTKEEGPGRIIVAADTLVALGRRVIPAPHTTEEARKCLDLLSGRSHRVYTCVAVVSESQGLRKKCVLTRVYFKVLSREEKWAYSESGEGIGKAGGYALQNFGGAFVKRINGSWSSVVGLPLLETRSLLISVGLPLYPLSKSHIMNPSLEGAARDSAEAKP